MSKLSGKKSETYRRLRREGLIQAEAMRAAGIRSRTTARRIDLEGEATKSEPPRPESLASREQSRIANGAFRQSAKRLSDSAKAALPQEVVETLEDEGEDTVRFELPLDDQDPILAQAPDDTSVRGAADRVDYVGVHIGGGPAGELILSGPAESSRRDSDAPIINGPLPEYIRRQVVRPKRLPRGHPDLTWGGRTVARGPMEVWRGQ